MNIFIEKILLLISVEDISEKFLNFFPLFLGIQFLATVSSLFLADKLMSKIKNLWFRLEKKFATKDQNLNQNRNTSNNLNQNQDRSFAQLIKKVNTKFDDVAGNEEAKLELKEVVKFLTKPESFSKLGATMPKGVLLSGPPGTGKTLFARAVAGEANRPFFKTSGSQFVELLVGLGAARVRELFQKARAVKPCIIFIDEIDSIGRARSGGSSMGGVNEEREQTLNQLLTEMDGFKTETGILVIAATNRVDILDPAIIRPGRFDRQIAINLPSTSEREAILKVHAKGKPLEKNIQLSEIAQQTPGFSGAQLANLMNEAAILAVRKKKQIITMDEISQTIERITLGIVQESSQRPKILQTIAYRETARALISTLLNPAEPVVKVSLATRGNKQGFTILSPSANNFPTKADFITKILVSLSPRAMEEIIYGPTDCTTNTQQDIFEATTIFRSMISRYAMTKLQDIKDDSQRQNLFLLGSDARSEIGNMVDNFTTNFIDVGYQQILYFLRLSRPIVDRIVDVLLNYGELNGNELRSLASEFFVNIEVIDPLIETRNALLYDLLFTEIAETPYELLKKMEQKANEINQKVEQIKLTSKRNTQIEPEIKKFLKSKK